MNTLFIILSFLAFSVNSITIRTYQLKCAKTKYDTDLFQSAFCIVASVAYLISGKFLFNLNLSQLFFAVLFGVFFASAVLFSALCYTSGPMSVTSVIVNSSVIIPIVYSCVSLKESMTLFQIIGCVLLLATFVLSAAQSDEKSESKINIKWLVFVFIAFLSNGITAVIQKNYKLSAPESDGNLFMSVAYFTSAVILIISFIVNRQKNKRSKNLSFKFSPLTAVLILAAGLGSFVGNGILMTLSTKVPAAILYPFLNGGLCITVSIFSILFFKEKLTLKKALTILTGLSAVIVLNL